MIKSKEYQVSEKDDNFTRLNLYYNAGSLIHLLGREKANAKIFDHLMRKSSDDLHKNKTRILYNYRYKMQESLRTLSAEFAADICQMSDELNELLDYVEQSHTLQSENLQQTEVKFEMLLQQLDRLNTS
jgi:uncharacterized protein YPO0396